MSRKAEQALARLATIYGVERSYEDVNHQRHEASVETMHKLLRALGAPVEFVNDAPDALREKLEQYSCDGIEPVITAWGGKLSAIPLRLTSRTGSRKLKCTIRLEDGTVRTIDAKPDAITKPLKKAGTSTHRVPLRRTLPVGYHDIEIETADRTLTSRIISAPRHGHAEINERDWGVFMPLYALRGRNDAGIGTFTELGELARWTAARGGSFVGTLPLLPSYVDVLFEPSPYSPVSRLFWNELFVDATRAPGWSPEMHALLPVRRDDQPVDYRRTGNTQVQALRAAAEAYFNGGDTDDLDRFTSAHPAITDYARFRAALDRRRESWHNWPERLRNGEIQDGDFAPEDERFHRYAQWVAETQIGEIAAASQKDAAGLYLDLPLGVNPNGFDAWREQGLFAEGASTGAPPDALFTGGQNWGFQPPRPDAQRESGHRYFAESLRHHMRNARMLRLDHVMALYRLYWIPNGAEAKDGAYVRYPVDELFAVLAVESSRHNTAVVGEDLGTVPKQIREQMDKHGVMRMYVVQYELSPDSEAILSEVPHDVVASVNTHDMPTFRGFVTGSELQDQLDLGLVDDARYQEDRKARHHLVQRLARRFDNAENTSALLQRILCHLAESDARALLVNLEDLWLESQPQNVPGTSTERQNWKRRAKLTLQEMMSDRRVLESLEMIDRRRRAHPRPAIAEQQAAEG